MRRSAALLLLNGELRAPSAVRAAARGAAWIVCADGGVRHAARLRLIPRLVIGDMDSLPARLPRWPATVYLCDFDPDRSDLEKALAFLAERGVREVAIAGGAGALDYTLVNLAVAERFGRGMAIRWIDEPEARLLGAGTHRLRCRPGQRLTLLALGERAVVTASGVLYPLRRAPLERSSRGLSNRVTSTTVNIRVHRGRLWAFF